MFAVLVLMSAVAILLFLCLLAVAPVLEEAMQRAERQRLVVEASWQLHQHVVATFSDMLQAARETQQPDNIPGEEPS